MGEPPSAGALNATVIWALPAATLGCAGVGRERECRGRPDGKHRGDEQDDEERLTGSCDSSHSCLRFLDRQWWTAVVGP